MKVKYANVLWRRRTWKQTMYIIHSDTFMWIHLQPLKRRRERTSRHTRKHRFTVTLYERTNTYFYPTKRKKYQRRIFTRCRLSPENPVLRRYVSKDKRHFTYFEESFRRVSLVGSPRRNKLRGNSAISIEVTEEVGTWSHTPAFYCNFGGTFTDQFERMENNKITKRERIEREINERENRTKNGCKQMNVRLRWNTR